MPSTDAARDRKSPLRPVVEVLLFAHAAELARVQRLELTVAPGATVASLWSALREQQPAVAAALEPLRPHLAMARNDRYAAANEPLLPGDSIALLPPVSGG